MQYLNLSYPKMNSKTGRVVLCKDSEHEICIKRMVAIMATSVNGVAANFLCVAASDLDQYIDRTVSMYTHFTSPLRRFSDCMLHFEIKRLLLELSKPSGMSMKDANAVIKKIPGSMFNPDERTRMLEKSKKAIAFQQSLHQKSVKLRIFQYIHQRIEKDGARIVRIKFKVIQQTKQYITLIIHTIDGHKVRVRHIIKRSKPDLVVNNNQEFSVDLTQCNPPKNKFNDNVLPEIELMF